MESQTPAAPSTDQTTATATTVTMPKAMESRNDVFITDQGSRCTSRRRALRVPRGRAVVAPARVVDEVEDLDPLDVRGPPLVGPAPGRPVVPPDVERGEVPDDA